MGELISGITGRRGTIGGPYHKVEERVFSAVAFLVRITFRRRFIVLHSFNNVNRFRTRACTVQNSLSAKPQCVAGPNLSEQLLEYSVETNRAAARKTGLLTRSGAAH